MKAEAMRKPPGSPSPSGASSGNDKNMSGPMPTVGGKRADFPEFTSKAIQCALDFAAAKKLPGVQCMDGVFQFNQRLEIPSGLTLRGAEATRFERIPHVTSPVRSNVNHYHRHVDVVNPTAFAPGMDIQIRGTAFPENRSASIYAKIIEMDGNRLWLDRPTLGKNFWKEMGEVCVSSRVPFIRTAHARGISIERLHLLGEPYAEEQKAGGAFCDAAYFWDCRNLHIRNVRVESSFGDGIAWEACRDTEVSDCEVKGSRLGLHAGSGSVRSKVQRCRLEQNNTGFYFCWGIENCTLSECVISNNSTYGVSIGFEDHNNLVVSNLIEGNHLCGIHFRKSHFPTQSPLDVQIESNTLRNNGPMDSPLAVLMEDAPDRTSIYKNLFEEQRGGDGTAVLMQTTVGPSIVFKSNHFSGFSRNIQDLRVELSPKNFS